MGHTPAGTAAQAAAAAAPAIEPEFPFTLDLRRSG